MVGEAFAALSVFNEVIGAFKALKEANDAKVRAAAQTELFDKLLAAHAAYMTLERELVEAKAKLAHFENWDVEKLRYQLCQFTPGTVAYLPKRSMAGDTPAHALCPNCFEKRVKSYLQHNGERLVNAWAHVCPTCRLTLKTGGEPIPEFAE